MSNTHARALAEKIKTAFRYGDAAGALTIEAAIKAVDQLAALSAPAAVAGWQLVPVEPTQAMLKRARPYTSLPQAHAESNLMGDIADELAERIAKITGHDIGEHSSNNDPWLNAKDAADEYMLLLPQPPKPAPHAAPAVPAGERLTGKALRELYSRLEPLASDATEEEIASWWRHYAGAVRNALAASLPAVEPAAAVVEPVALFKQMVDGYFAECKAEKEIEKILGLEFDSLAGLSFDYYDCSFEIFAPEEVEDIAVTTEQNAQILALGCSRYWINFADGTERYCTGIRKPGSGRWRKFDAGEKQERRALATAPQAAPAEPAQADGGAELREALRDMLAGWKYIRSTHGDLYGVGWDRAQNKAEAALAAGAGV